MQINMPESGTFLFISDHCHIIENVSMPFDFIDGSLMSLSGAMASLKGGWQETIQPGSEALNG